jgi:hypothetical protein
VAFSYLLYDSSHNKIHDTYTKKISEVKNPDTLEGFFWVVVELNYCNNSKKKKEKRRTRREKRRKEEKKGRKRKWKEGKREERFREQEYK